MIIYYNMVTGEGKARAMEWKEEVDEMTGKEIANLIKLQADEGKTPREALEALMKVVGAEMPEFSRED